MGNKSELSKAKTIPTIKVQRPKTSFILAYHIKPRLGMDNKPFVMLDKEVKNDPD